MMRETIVVEGRDDITAVKRAVNCHVIATGGSHISKRCLQEIRAAQAQGGVIVLTDPDYAGIRLRNAIERAVPGVLHAHLPRHRADRKGRAGVEYAAPEDIRRALAAVQSRREAKETNKTADSEPVTMGALFALGLTGKPDSEELRAAVAARLSIGHGGAKRLLAQLNHFGIGLEQLERIVEEVRHGS